ncbi:MAG: hypothetical protein PHC38_10785, partial [Weeksellaceae bacterium]|nr:hypothetical protein [Weeksellaceae bacterium]
FTLVAILRNDKFVFLVFFQSVQQVCAAAHAGHTQHLPKSGGSVVNQALCFYQSLCLVDSEVLRNRHLRQHAKRYATPLNATAHSSTFGFPTAQIQCSKTKRA